MRWGADVHNPENSFERQAKEDQDMQDYTAATKAANGPVDALDVHEGDS